MTKHKCLHYVPFLNSGSNGESHECMSKIFRLSKHVQSFLRCYYNQCIVSNFVEYRLACFRLVLHEALPSWAYVQKTLVPLIHFDQL